ncbi:hypothetical protein X798_05079 [Onchocerca flexuosa]|uniref:Uncharacterized protein n=1 Tax=Onchocerca flexuosa TaxID=387005 RepID=A0A238BR76_9BILA|nr:hypothetical protein X798_05079 [Onchocerca flexuosa]
MTRRYNPNEMQQGDESKSTVIKENGCLYYEKNNSFYISTTKITNKNITNSTNEGATNKGTTNIANEGLPQTKVPQISQTKMAQTKVPQISQTKMAQTKVPQISQTKISTKNLQTQV